MISANPSLLEWSTDDSRTTDIDSFVRQHADPVLYYGSGKAALHDGLTTLVRAATAEPDTVETWENVVLPAYLPDAVVEPIVDCGLEPRQYAITDDLAPNFGDLEARIDDQTLAIMSVNYFGFPQPGLEEVASLAARHDCYHIDDNAHGALSFDDGRLLGTRGDIGFTSLWKLLPIPDGALLYLSNPSVAEHFEGSALAGVEDTVHAADLQFVVKSLATGLLDANRTVKESVHRLVANNGLSGPATDPRRRYESSKAPMSRLSAYLVQEADPIEIRSARRSNYRAWASLFEKRPDVELVFESLPTGVCPHVCPVRTKHPTQLRRLLEDYGVDGTHTWPRLSANVRDNPDYETAHRLAAEVVVLPVHQHIDPRTILEVANAIDRQIG
ncbi:DegT/DnrJ/EryC1/StrS family aminotransferase [Natronosalvus vescus]|uniref:DegT/DnrJ/EryC1/StrS family aminotransferase n=1 Tax=Natronosalvus vescus TaxID=2953881 RepID=UPI0020902BC1|nr:DegT/DnrJ/EryC1/StrS family aminotransferase [Natronosalvus vescus]